MKSSIPVCPPSTVGPGKDKYIEKKCYKLQYNCPSSSSDATYDTVGIIIIIMVNNWIAPRYNDSNGNSPVPSPSPTPSVSNQRPPRPVSLTVPSLLGKDPSSLSHGSAGSLVEAVSVCVNRLEKVTLKLKQCSTVSQPVAG